MEYRTEKDSLGEVKVPADKYWGAVTERSLENFKIGNHPMPYELVRAIAEVKLAAARANARLLPGRMTEEKLSLIERAASEIISGELIEHFPLSVFQTGSGTQTNMNVNEVIANRANELAGRRVLSPNDDVNMSQSSNDVFPTAMHLAVVKMTRDRVLPAINGLVSELLSLEERSFGIVKSGRTHLQDATPIAFSQEVSGWRYSLECDYLMIEDTLRHLEAIALGGTAVGTGLNSPIGFDTLATEELSRITGLSLRPSANKFHSLSSKSELVFAHGALKALAADLMKIANDVRWLASGPRLGLGEITIPAGEPGSSIMPGKVNPTQCEALTMVAVAVMANDSAVTVGASQGNLELNVYMPIIIKSYLDSLELLSDGMSSFKERCVSGIEVNRERMHSNLHMSLMLATALTPHIGYERAAEVVHLAHGDGLSLREACLRLGYMDEEGFDNAFHPEEMICSK